MTWEETFGKGRGRAYMTLPCPIHDPAWQRRIQARALDFLLYKGIISNKKKNKRNQDIWNSICGTSYYVFIYEDILFDEINDLPAVGYQFNT